MSTGPKGPARKNAPTSIRLKFWLRSYFGIRASISMSLSSGSPLQGSIAAERVFASSTLFPDAVRSAETSIVPSMLFLGHFPGRECLNKFVNPALAEGTGHPVMRRRPRRVHMNASAPGPAEDVHADRTYIRVSVHPCCSYCEVCHGEFVDRQCLASDIPIEGDVLKGSAPSVPPYESFRMVALKPSAFILNPDLSSV